MKVTRTGDAKQAIQKADSIAKAEFSASVDRSIESIFKTDDGDFLIWGPASIEVVDKENDRITAEALEKALPQLLKRARFSYEHTDQIVGKILKRFETEEPVEVQIDGTTYKRETFPTDVLDLDDGNPAGLYVGGEVYGDSDQAQDVRRGIEDKRIDSYSISGEALMTEKQVQDGKVFDNILELDLSAITLCEEGMNQPAKFSKVSGEDVSVTEIVPPDMDDSRTEKTGSVSMQETNPQFETADASVSNPTQVKKQLVKSMSSNEIDGDIATKEFVTNKTDDVIERSEQRAVNTVEKMLPDGDLVTKSVVEQMIDSRMKEDGHEMEDYEDDEMDEMDEMEDYEDDEMKGDYEDDEMEDEDEEKAAEGHDYEEHVKPDAEHEDRSDILSRAELKQELPADVWEVVSKYIGETEAETDTDTEKSASEFNSVDEAISEVLGVDDTGQMEVGMADRADEIDKMTAEEDGDGAGGEIVTDESPALTNFRH